MPLPETRMSAEGPLIIRLVYRNFSRRSRGGPLGMPIRRDARFAAAAKTRATAQAAGGLAAKRLLLDTAAGYDKLAEKAKHRRLSAWVCGAD